ncbi:MAG: glycosyltransferase family 2 protein [Pseudomonadota bacterium]
MSRVTVVILTLNESRHIERALRSVASFADRVLVVDSGSSDDTADRARALGAEVRLHRFVNHADQFNWALTQLPAETEWVLRLDADEVVSEALARDIAARLPGLSSQVAGLTVPRRIVFLGHPMRYGGVCPTHVLRLFRYGRGRSESRWMDEHIVVDGAVEWLGGELIDDNRNPLGWWIDKHNGYASREALQLLLAQASAAPRPGRPPPGVGKAEFADPQGALARRTGVTRWFKDRVYGRLPVSLRALAYFLYRYLLRGGFRDGFPGLAFHALQGFWYRFLVDAKLYEARAHLALGGGDLTRTARDVLGIDLSGSAAGAGRPRVDRARAPSRAPDTSPRDGAPPRRGAAVGHAVLSPVDHP